jgi:hypothetical protein
MAGFAAYLKLSPLLYLQEALLNLTELWKLILIYR